MNYFDIIFPVVTFGIGAGLGWYVKGRGLTGVKVDLGNATKKTEEVVKEIKQDVAPTVG